MSTCTKLKESEFEMDLRHWPLTKTQYDTWLPMVNGLVPWELEDTESGRLLQSLVKWHPLRGDMQGESEVLNSVESCAVCGPRKRCSDKDNSLRDCVLYHSWGGVRACCYPYLPKWNECNSPPGDNNVFYYLMAVYCLVSMEEGAV